MWERWFALLAAIAAFCSAPLLACSKGNDTTAQTRGEAVLTADALPTSVPVGRYGIGCRTCEEPNVVGPPSYLVSDIGKPGVPTLTADQLTLVHRIRHYLHSKTLRFAFVNAYNRGPRFIVFEGDDAPCSDAALGYPVLNSDTNEFYEPGEAPSFVHPGPPLIGPTSTPYPWTTPPGKEQ
jgi:hypothetical protein